MAKQTDNKETMPRMRQFLSAQDLSFLENKATLQHKSLEDTAASNETADSGVSESKDAGIPIKINTVIAAQFSKLKKDAQIEEDTAVEKNGQNVVKTTTPTVKKVTGVKITLSTFAPTTVPLKTTSKPDTSFLIPKSDLKAIVSQDPALLRTLITATTQKFRPSTSSKSSDVRTTHASNADKVTNSFSTPAPDAFTTRKPFSATTTTIPLFTSVLHQTPPNIPLMVGGGLAFFIIMLLIAIVVLLVRLKNKKGNMSMRNESGRSNVSKDTDASDIKSRRASSSRRDSTDSNIYSEIGSEVRDDDISDIDDDDDDVIYYWGESEWDSESRHNSVLSLSYTTKTESARNSAASGGRLSVLGVPKRGRRKSSLLAQSRLQGSSADLRKNRQSTAGAIFSIPEGDDVHIDQNKRIEIKKDDLYKKVLKEKRSQSLF